MKSIHSLRAHIVLFNCIAMQGIAHAFMHRVANAFIVSGQPCPVDELEETYWHDSHVGSSMPQNLTSVAALPAIFIWSAAAAAALSSALMLPFLLLP